MRGLRAGGAVAVLALALCSTAQASSPNAACVDVAKSKSMNLARIPSCTALLKSVKNDDERIHLLIGRADAYARTGAPLRALLDIDRVEHIDPTQPSIAYGRAIVYMVLGFYARAQPEIESVMRGGWRSADVYSIRGSVYAYQGRYGDAIQDLDLSITSDPSLAQSYLVRGFANLESGEIERAIKDFDAAIRLDPKNADAYGYRGRAHFALDQYKDALADFEEARRLDPNNPGPADYISDLHAMIDTPAPVPATNPSGIQPSRAIGYSHNCTAYYPFISNWTVETGDVLIHYDVAADGAISNVGIDRSSGFERLDRAAVICVSHHWRNAPATRDGVPIATPRHQAIIRYTNSRTGADVDLYRGETFAGLGDYGRAIAMLNIAAREDPTNAEIFECRGLVFYVTGDYRSAIQDFDKALKLKPGLDEAAAGRELASTAVTAGLNPGSKGI